MSKTKATLTIPKSIKVGFQARPGTYTGKLAYVVYKDSKGVLRKEKSWEQWRSKEIDPKDFENVPTSGFVLNKKVGETRYGWNPRKAWVRVWDPRDFEFEISVANLLFILEECSSIKGKGLEGEFVYSWDGAELVLLPVSSQDYKASAQHNNLQEQKVTAKEMQEGCIYQHKDNYQIMYLGRHEWYGPVNTHQKGSLTHAGKRHIFVTLDGKSTYLAETGFTRLATRVTSEPSTDYADEYTKFQNSGYCSRPVGFTAIPANLKLDGGKGYFSKILYYQQNHKFYPIEIGGSWRYEPSQAISPGKLPVRTKLEYYYRKHDRPAIFRTSGKVFKISASLDPHLNNPVVVTKEELEHMVLFDLHIKCENGGTIPVEHEYSYSGSYSDDNDDD